VRAWPLVWLAALVPVGRMLQYSAARRINHPPSLRLDADDAFGSNCEFEPKKGTADLDDTD
jgi:hypothetical protein